MTRCEVCHGSGEVERRLIDADGLVEDASVLEGCPRCAGLGMTIFPLSAS